MRNVRARVTLIVLIATVTVPTLAVAKDILRCGQTVDKHEVGVVLNDIACPSEVGSCRNDESIQCTSNNSCPVINDATGICAFGAVYVEKGGRLLLKGHTLSTTAPGSWALEAGGGTIEGPGTITAPGGWGILCGSVKIKLRNLTIRDSGFGIVGGLKTVIDATDLEIRNNTEGGIGSLKVLQGSNIVVNGNGLEPGTPPGSVIGAGIRARTVRVDGLTAEGNGGPGVDARVVKLKHSTVTGNNGFLQGLDITAKRQPRLVDSTCGASGRLSDGDVLLGTWGVCAGD